MSKYKVGDIVYYDSVELKHSYSKYRYGACKIEKIKKATILREEIQCWGKWYKFDHVPTPNEILLKNDDKKLTWMGEDEIHLINIDNINKRLN
jgi:hypothetical protein